MRWMKDNKADKYQNSNYKLLKGWFLLSFSFYLLYPKNGVTISPLSSFIYWSDVYVWERPSEWSSSFLIYSYLLVASNFLLALSLINNNPNDKKIPVNPIVTKNSEECLNPVAWFPYPAAETISDEMIGKKARAILSIICMIPKAVPMIFFLTTKGIDGTIQLA